MADNRPSLAIVIVTFNSRGEIQGCLDSLVGHTEPFPATITVVDNASTDGTAAFIRERWPSVKVIDGGGNLGFSRANNIGIRASKSDYVLLMNPDTVAPPGGIQTLVRGLAAYGAAAVAGPRLLNDRNFPELSWGPTISPLGELTQKVLATLYHRKVRRVVPGPVEFREATVVEVLPPRGRREFRCRRMAWRIEDGGDREHGERPGGGRGGP